MDAIKLRAWWAHVQGLDGQLLGSSPTHVLARTGWARSVAGVGPYLTMFSRAGVGRAQADSAVAEVNIHELPSARGCTYVLPDQDFALGLKLSQGFSGNEMTVARKLGVTDEEVDGLCKAVLRALEHGPLDPDELRQATGGASRSLGEAGKKKGISTTLPLALGKLQSEGEIRRMSLNGRLDQQRYRYALWRPNPLTGFALPLEACYTELARRYFSWIGPARLSEFQWFSGLSAKVCKAALEPLDLEPVEPGSDLLILREQREMFEAFEVPKQPCPVLVSSLDGLVLLRRDVASLVAPETRNRLVPAEKGPVEIGSVDGLPSHAIFDRGSLVGVWEYDVESAAIVWLSFGAKTTALKKAVARTEEFVRTALGDARSFSLDSPKSRAPKIAALRAAAG